MNNLAIGTRVYCDAEGNDVQAEFYVDPIDPIGGPDGLGAEMIEGQAPAAPTRKAAPRKRTWTRPIG